MAMFDKHKIGKQSSPDPEEPKVSPPAPPVGTGSPMAAAKVAMIGQGIRIVGDVKADSSLKIEGRIEGRIVQCADEIEIAECGEVTASITARVVRISGLVSGDIGGGEKVLITRSGRVQGNIVAPRVQLEDGALFRGSIDMNPAKAASADKPTASIQPAAKSASTDNGQKTTASATAKSTSNPLDTDRKEPGLNLKSG